jgi:MoaA/NifB/PqqE/SkfB family radical SAM enzyme
MTKHKHPGMISLLRMQEIIAEFAELSPAGKVVICGGEPTLDPAAYFGVCNTARRLGVQTLSVVNGTTITTLDDALLYAQNGPDEISISLDSPDQSTHDLARGQPGSFYCANRAVAYLLKARRLYPQNGTKVNVMGLLSASSFHQLDAFYDLVLNKLEADKLKLNAIQPSFLNPRITTTVNDTFFAMESQIDPGELKKTLTACDEKWKLKLDPEWIVQMVSYFADLWQKPRLELGWGGGFITSRFLCNSWERNIMVDVAGRASLCFSSQFHGEQLTQKGDLRRFWENATWRGAMANCRALCGISHSVRRTSATLKA